MPNQPRIDPHDARVQRAATEPMEIIPLEESWRFTVRTQSGIYTVDTHAKSCTCKDFQMRVLKLRRTNPNALCKHLWRVLYGKRMLQAAMLIPQRKRTEWQEAV